MLYSPLSIKGIESRTAGRYFASTRQMYPSTALFLLPSFGNVSGFTVAVRSAREALGASCLEYKH
jgi:hypothetical protein